NIVSWVALTLPYLEHSPVYNSINFSIHGADATWATAWYTRINVLSCPSDGDQQGFRPDANQGGGGLGQYATSAAPANPAGGAPMVPVMNYAVSFGDNYCVGALNPPGYATETPTTLWPTPPGVARIGWPGYQGTYADINGNLPPTGAPGSL